MRGACFLMLPLLLHALQPQHASAASLRPRPNAVQMGPLAYLLLRRPPQHRDPLLGDLGQDPLSDEMGETALASLASQGSGDGDQLMRPTKRQVRYYQCYFNPISCFG